MSRIWWLALTLGLLVALAPAARAHDSAPTARDVAAAVDSYLGHDVYDATLVGETETSGYEEGFWVRGGEFELRINLLVQARYEWFDYDNEIEGLPIPTEDGAQQIHDVSGFSVPRLILMFAGEAPCGIRYLAELDLAYEGRENLMPGFLEDPENPTLETYVPLQPQANEFGRLREAWIEWGCHEAFNIRMGIIRYPNTRQLLVSGEEQLFVDISMASAVVGILLPGFSDRNRDYGLQAHGRFGCRREFEYRLAVTNGDGGDSARNVLDYETSDNLAYSGRLNWAFAKPIGYTEGATLQNRCAWYGEVGAWGFYYADRFDRPHGAYYDRLLAGVDLAVGYGGFTFTGAFSYVDLRGSDLQALQDEQWLVWLVQAGYLFPGSAWEIIGRWSAYQRTIEGLGAGGADAKPETNEIGLGLNYYLNGHSNKITFDAHYISADTSAGVEGGYYDTYAGVPLGWRTGGNHVYVRLQWQLVL